MAPSGPPAMSAVQSLPVVNRTWGGVAVRVAFDPTETWGVAAVRLAGMPRNVNIYAGSCVIGEIPYLSAAINEVFCHEEVFAPNSRLSARCGARAVAVRQRAGCRTQAS